MHFFEGVVVYLKTGGAGFVLRKILKTFSSMHLTKAFIQSNLHCFQGKQCLFMHA